MNPAQKKIKRILNIQKAIIAVFLILNVIYILLNYFLLTDETGKRILMYVMIATQALFLLYFVFFLIYLSRKYYKEKSKNAEINK